MFRRYLTSAVFALVTTVAAPVGHAASVTVSNFAGWNGATDIGDFGASGFSAWGQFFTVPAGMNRLDSFTFYLADALNGSNTQPVPVKFQAHLVAYDPPTRLVTSGLLWSSVEIEIPVTATPVFLPYTFAPGATVTEGRVYQMFLFANNYELRQPRDSRLRLASSPLGFSTYEGGAQNTPRNAEGSLTEVLAGPWSFTAGFDLIFSATFSDTAAPSVPEPAPLALAGIAAVAGVVARRRAPPADGRHRRPLLTVSRARSRD